MNAIERVHENLSEESRLKLSCDPPTPPHDVLGAARFRTDQHAQGKWLADLSTKPID
jgi:hypothetical protein